MDYMIYKLYLNKGVLKNIYTEPRSEWLRQAGTNLLKTPCPVAGWLAQDLSWPSHSQSYLSLSSIGVGPLWLSS